MELLEGLVLAETFPRVRVTSEIFKLMDSGSSFVAVPVTFLHTRLKARACTERGLQDRPFGLRSFAGALY